MEDTRLLPSKRVTENLEEVAAGGSKKDRMFLIGASLTDREKKELTVLLQYNLDVFEWEPNELPGIYPNVVCHRLHVDPTFKRIA